MCFYSQQLINIITYDNCTFTHTHTQSSPTSSSPSDPDDMAFEKQLFDSSTAVDGCSGLKRMTNYVNESSAPAG